MSDLLINEPPLQVLPRLAELIGLNEAILLQQIHYWLIRSKHHVDGRKWIYNSATKWKEQFPFWSESTIRRTVGSLKNQKLIVTTGKYNKIPMDKTLWYSIEYDVLNRLTIPCSQNDHTIQSNWIDETVNMTRAIPENTTETNNKRFNLTSESQEQGMKEQNQNRSPAEQVIAYSQKKMSDGMASKFKLMLAEESKFWSVEVVKHLVDRIAEDPKKSVNYYKKIIDTWAKIKPTPTTAEEVIAGDRNKNMKSRTKKKEADSEFDIESFLKESGERHG